MDNIPVNTIINRYIKEKKKKKIWYKIRPAAYCTCMTYCCSSYQFLLLFHVVKRHRVVAEKDIWKYMLLKMLVKNCCSDINRFYVKIKIEYLQYKQKSNIICNYFIEHAIEN
jgi:carbon starvation protein CstA